MYQLILIDDEELVLSQLEQFIDWASFGFYVAGTFSSGAAALAYMAENHTDAVITDIQMDEVNGLDFAALCQREYPETVIAFISAYRDFEYARAAIDYNVVGYILKPILRQELFDLCKKIKVILDQRIAMPSSPTFTSESFTDLKIQDDCQQIFSDLFCGVIHTSEELADRLSALTVDIDPDRSPCALLNIHLQDFRKYLDEVWKYDEFRLYNAINLLIPFEQPDCYILSVLYAQGNIEIIVICKEHANDFSGRLKQHMQTLQEKLRSALRLNAEITVIREYPAVSDMLQTVKDQPATEEIILNDTIQQAVDYMRENYASITSLEDVAKHVHLSPVYFGRFFKQHMQENVNTYLNKIRIEQAKRLLSENNIKLFYIGEAVGYKSSRYFFKTFKNLTGMTPAQYKEKHGKQ